MNIYLFTKTLLTALIVSRTVVTEETQADDRKTLLIGGMFPMSGGWAGGIGCKPAIEMALQDVNNNPDILKGYKLELMPVDTQCLPGLGLRKMYDLLYDNKTKLVLLTGCSSVSTFVAQAARMWNLIVLSYGSSSPALSDRKRFPTFFRTHPSATLNNPTRLMLFDRFNWTRIATIQQTEEVFTSTIKDLEERIKQYSAESDQPIEIAVRQSFQTDPTNAVKSLKRQDARIIVGVFYEDMARKVFCEAYKQGLYGKKHVWLIIGWYPDSWYTKPDENIDCTPEQLKIALEGHLTTEVVQYNLNETIVTKAGIKTEDFRERLETELNNQGLGKTQSLTSLAGYVEAPLAYDAVWALTLALENSIKDLEQIGKSLEQFNYKDNEIKDILMSYLNRTDFEGVSGQVSFTSTGDRISKTQIEQMQNGTYEVIAVYNYINSELDWKDTDHWQGGKPPADRTLILTKLREISKPLFYVMLTLACVGALLTLISLMFNVCSLRYSIIANSLPVLNSQIAIGCVMCLACVPLFGLDGAWFGEAELEKNYNLMCQVRTWMLAYGFTNSYGAMFIKILYSWRISKIVKSTAKAQSTKVINEILTMPVPMWEPYVMQIALLLIDSILLFSWYFVDPLTRTVELFPEEAPPTDESHMDIMYEPQLEHCSCNNMNIWKGVMYGYKGCLLVIGLFLAYETRSVKIRKINDLRFVAMAVYNVVVLCLIAVPVTIIIPNQQNARFVFISVAIILSCYLTIGLLFIPKMVPILSKRLDMDEEETQKSLIHHENEKRYEQLKERSDSLKQEISQKEKRIRELHGMLQKKFSAQVSAAHDDSRASDSAFSEEGSNNDRMQELSEASNASKTNQNHN